MEIEVCVADRRLFGLIVGGVLTEETEQGEGVAGCLKVTLDEVVDCGFQGLRGAQPQRVAQVGWHDRGIAGCVDA